ncbi:MAG: hypothetical protein A4E62_00380 [Syntrophorhabdus sp. PtaU1.Bin002]|nr:MAG: hypothetical protein A4E62_00380 [Syntrophorhabdus sp. PtaU1.Bin002]
MCRIDAVMAAPNNILKAMPYDFPLTERPYRDIAVERGMSEKELIETLSNLRTEGFIRRIAAILHHRRAAYTCNVMVVWRVPEEDVERVGRVMASFPEVSHCYERGRGSYWDYNVFTMVHGRSSEECADTVKRISTETGIVDFQLFASKREFKKTSLMVTNG